LTAPLPPPQPSQTTGDAVAVNKNNKNPVAKEGIAKPPAIVGSESKPETKLFPENSTEKSIQQNQDVEKKYTLQVASFKKRDQAELFCKKISPLGYKPRVMIVDLPKKGKWFRVVIEKFKTEEEARKAAGVLSGKIKGVNCVIRPTK
jgi:cell division protein FtsN